MSNIPTVSTNINNTIVTTGGVPGRSIAVVGHSSNFTGNTFDTGVRGEVLHYTSFTDWVNALGGTIDGTGWVAGAKGDGSTIAGSSPYDTKDNLIRALELIYAANPSADVYACVLNGTGTDPQTQPTGMSEALDELLLYQDIAYVVGAGLDPLAVGKTHAESAASGSNPYNSPRFYVAGVDLFYVWDTLTNNPPLDATDLSAYSSVKSAVGLVLTYVGNHKYTFSVAPSTEGSVEIGGQFAAAYLAGVLSSQAPNFPLTNYPNGLGANYWNGDVYHFKVAELDAAIGDGWIIPRFVNNSNVFAKGVNYSSDTSWSLYPVREITNFLHKSLATALRGFIGKINIPGNIAGAKRLAEGILIDAVNNRLISSYNVDVRDHPSEVDAIRAIVNFTTVKPINKIYLDITVS